MNKAALPLEIWTARAQKHASLIEPFTSAFIKRRDVGHKHPVHDFLFVYYSCSPLKLKQWVPSFEEHLIVSEQTLQNYPWLNEPWFTMAENVLSLNKTRINKHMLSQANFIAELCDNILQRQPRFGCFGLHEWAMVYKSSPEAIRHNGYSLRLPMEKLIEFVESQTLCCTHYDAYRFFTPEARPRNTLSPCLASRLQMEQGGCVHANMDLYKWATKLWPWIGSDFMAKAFFLALEARELDMRSSPYDLRADGYEPIYIETEEGRKQYQQEQQRLTERATPLRKELQAFCVQFLKVQFAAFQNCSLAL